MIKEYLFHIKKLFYIIVFGSLVWFISFTLFPENQIIKISIGDISPTTFTAPKYIEIIDEDKTERNKEIAIQSVSPIYSIDNDLNNSSINGITDMFLTVIEARTDEASSLVIHTVDHPGGPEAFCVAVTEAMASARPVITSRCGGLIDQIQDGKQGIVVEQRDVNGLADAMIRLGTDTQLRAKMGKAARDRAAKMFDASDLAHRVEDLAIEIAESATVNSRKK